MQTAAGTCAARLRGQRSWATFITLFSTTAGRFGGGGILQERVAAAATRPWRALALAFKRLQFQAMVRWSSAATPRVAQKPPPTAALSTLCDRQRGAHITAQDIRSALGCRLQARLLLSAAKTEAGFSLFSTARGTCAAGLALEPNRTLPYAAFISGTAAALIFTSSRVE